ncbi:sugar ABC transporter permease [Streptomyces sp. NBC_00264]|uniref:carbohydrate ABC transporter permease n=1 Tax=unclassified Streptomyces TaxID=2593676 RepID=UPI002254BF24|nr:MULTISPECIES: sugar ABC transporter permease [unclassified Streptomyces]MCX4398954.1 sugar ABC transporter permease [Streptomyces sp. NBC_01767]MCX5158158.1 sugar ABC transporter permease [Streptomyces sp. NBC_00305]MCX5216681.1 sugar ABC transporter permease [Streptomyces sp. NBC_00264]WSC25900.1 sugar ABC transporter permease [Streptomyces sp. NBC_01768]
MRIRTLTRPEGSAAAPEAHDTAAVRSQETPARRPSRPSRRFRPNGGPGRFALFAAPGLLAYLALVLVPIGMTAGYSLTDKNPFNPPTRWVGLSNLTSLFSDDDFLKALQNTVVITVIVTLVTNAGGLAIALLLDRRGWLYNALRSVFFVPVVLSAVVVSVIWQAILVDDGLLNSMLRQLGVSHPPGWLSDPSLALYTVSWVIAWQALGFCVVIYLAGLQGIPQELHEAAAIDGCGPLMRFRHVTWPMLAPAVTINTVMSLIGGFKAYDQIQVLTNGGPGPGTTSTLAFQVIQTAFNGNHVGYASAMAVAMLILVATVSVIALGWLQKREVSA